LRQSLGVALVLAVWAAACAEPARRLASGPGGGADALALVEALALRFGESSREPAFDTLRPKLARAALVPSWIWDDTAAWPRQGESWRAVEFAGFPSGSEYRFGVRPFAPEPVAVGQYRGQLRLDKLASGRFEWTLREELAMGALRPAKLAAALDALLRGSEAADEPRARAAIAAAFPRASSSGCCCWGHEPRRQCALVPADLRPRRRATQRSANTTNRCARGGRRDGRRWTLEGEEKFDRPSLARGWPAPLEGDILRGFPSACITSDYATRLTPKILRVSWSRVADADACREGFVAPGKPDWDTVLVEPLLDRSATPSTSPARRLAGRPGKRPQAPTSSATTAHASPRIGCCAGSAA
jgi:hypothetical protein